MYMFDIDGDEELYRSELDEVGLLYCPSNGDDMPPVTIAELELKAEYDNIDDEIILDSISNGAELIESQNDN